MSHPLVLLESEGREGGRRRARKLDTWSEEEEGPSDQTKRERASEGGSGVEWSARGRGSGRGGVDGCRFPPALPLSLPEPATGVFLPRLLPSLPHCQKPKPQLQKEFFSPLARSARLSYGKAIPRLYAHMVFRMAGWIE